MPPPEFFSWTFPGAPIRIDLRLDVVERLKREVTRSARSETGGILLGSAAPGSPQIVRITDFQPFPHEGGGPYSLTLPERHAFARIVWDLKRLEDVVAVGYYRSHLRQGLRLDEHDLAVMRSSLPGTADVVLLMRRESRRDVEAGFFFWDGGRIHPDYSFLEFPLEVGELRERRTEERPAALARGVHRRSPLLWGALGLLAILALVALWLPRSTGGRRTGLPSTERSTRSPSSLTSPELGLRCEVSGGDLRLSWDRSLPAITAARAGALSIRDGSRDDSISLGPDQLRAGSVTYTHMPGSRIVSFQLQVLDAAGHTVTQDLVAAVSRPSVVAAAPSPAKASTETRPVITAPMATTAERREVPAPPESHPLKHFEPPAAPAARAATPPSPLDLPALSGITRPALPPGSPLPALLVNAPPAPPSVLPLPPVASAEYIPPKPLRQVQPVLPPNISSIVPHRMRVQVRVSIDQNGKIVDAEPVSSGGAPANLLGTLAASAARLWLFEPARNNSRPVPAEVIVNFDFVPGAK